jgi:hypothetical protein
MLTGTWLLAVLAVAGSPAPHASPVASPRPAPGTVLIFLVDNSASLPPLDPEEKRVVALEKMFSFVEGQPYRLILFGGREELAVDEAERYRNDGHWTDFYFAFQQARELMQTYPPGTDFKLILLTDAILDPAPADWRDEDIPATVALKDHVARKTIELVRQMGTPLYVILVGEPPDEGAAPGDPERAPGFVLELIRAANGAKGAALAQTLSGFFKDDGVLLKKFIFRVEPEEGLKKIEPAVRRIARPARPGVDLRFLSVLILPLTLFLGLLLGILVRSFPGPGDVEVLELGRGAHVHVAADHLHKLASGGWATTGLSLVADAKDAAASFTYEAPQLDHSGEGLSLEGLDPLTAQLLGLGIDELARAIESYSDSGTKEEKIYALNLDYMAKNFDSREAEHLLTAQPFERARLAPLDFLRAKAHLISNQELRSRLVEPRVHFVSYGKHADRKELVTGSTARIGPYVFLVQDLLRGGRKDVRLGLAYQHVPSFLGLKTLVPGALQRLLRFRRRSERLVT